MQIRSLSGLNFPRKSNEAFRLKVLIIDDDKLIRDGLKIALDSHGAEAICCENATEALLCCMLEKFHFIVTDFKMPGMNGVELTKRLRARHPRSIIIGMSSLDVAEEFLHAGANDFLVKPFSWSVLGRMLEGEPPPV